MVEPGKRQSRAAGSLPGYPNGKGFPLPADGLRRHLPFGKLALLGIGAELADHLPELGVVPLLGLEVLPGFAQSIGQLSVLSAEPVLIAAHGLDRPLSATVGSCGRDLGCASPVPVDLVPGAEPGDGALLAGQLTISAMEQVGSVEVRFVLGGVGDGAATPPPRPGAVLAGRGAELLVRPCLRVEGGETGGASSCGDHVRASQDDG